MTAPSLLITRIRVSPLPPRPVRRERLVEALEREVGRRRLVLLSAPAGYGKTTLLSQWAHDSDLPVAWLTLEKGEGEVARFFRYLLGAWEQVAAEIRESRLGKLLGGTSPEPEAIVTAFVNSVAERAEPLVFVLDDFHLMESPAVQEALATILDHAPPTLHFVIAGRGEPPLPLARYRARGQMASFDAEALRFSLAESRAFLNQKTDVAVPPETVAPLVAQLEGWAAGLQLAALALRPPGARRTDTVSVKGRQRYIADYLGQEVLARQPEAIRHFLLQTSILDRLCAPLCAAVTGAEGAQEMLERLERADLFLLPLDGRREWFRYHHFFARFLRRTLSRERPGDLPALHRRAGRWYLAADLPEQAVTHAIAGDDADLIIRILERHLVAKLLGGDINLIRQWLEALPEAWRLQIPMVLLARAAVMMVTGQFEACARYLDQVEAHTFGDEEEAALYGARVTAMRCNIACFQNDLARAEAFAERALHTLSEDDVDFRGGIHGALGDTYRRHGRWEDAKTAYLKLLDFAGAPSFRVQAAHLYGALADLAIRRGRLHDAAGYWEEALVAIEQRDNWGHIPLPVSGWVHIRMGELLYEWNQLDGARQHLAEGLERAELGGDVRAQIAGYLLAGRLKLAAGDVEAAQACLEQARPLVDQAQFAHWTGRFERFRLELWLAQDELPAARRWAEEVIADAAAGDGPESVTRRLALARLLIAAEAEPATRALDLLETLRAEAAAQGREGIQIEALALQAMARRQQGDEVKALALLERALRLAEPEGYVRLFADLGLPMGRLLQEAHGRAVMADYVATLLAAFGGDHERPDSGPSPLPEPLTEREVEVLELMAAGLTNREIGEELVIAPGTVKKHASNIYSKLDVGSRTEAAARARSLGLLA